MFHACCGCGWLMMVGFSTRKKGQNFPWNVASAIINSLWILNLIHQPSTFRMKHCRGLKLRVLFFLGSGNWSNPGDPTWDALWGVWHVFCWGLRSEVTEDEFPPFWVVCAEGHVECARLLLDAGVNINKACFFYRLKTGVPDYHNLVIKRLVIGDEQNFPVM